MTALAKYDAACRAIAEATATDELLSIRDTGDRLRAAAIVANNRDLEVQAAEIRIRAERRLGEMMEAQRAAGLLVRGRPKKGSAADPNSKVMTLADIGVDKRLADRARKLFAVPDTQFARELAKWREHALADSARVTVTLARTSDKRERRAEKEAALAARILALPDRRYGVIYADPPWRFEPRSRETGMDRAPENHYPTATTEDICRLPVDELAAADAVLFLWATVPMIDDALIVLAAWGFSYKSHVVWRKVFPGAQKGTGYWFRNEHELLLVGTRGEVPAPAPGLQWSSVVDAPVGRHSAKPERFRGLIEDYFPTLPKIELFYRSRVLQTSAGEKPTSETSDVGRGDAPAGWDVFGNEAEPSGREAGQEARSAGRRDREAEEGAAT